LYLRGFSVSQAAEAQAWVLGRGFRVVRSLGAAQVILAGPGAEKELVDVAQRRGLKLQRWEAFQARYEAVAVVGDGCGGEEGRAAVSVVEVEPEVPILPLVERDEQGRVKVLGMSFERPQLDGGDARLVPGAERFAHLCMDQVFVNTVVAVLQGVRWGYPVALEGETAASKTTAVLWLAHVLGQPVARLNLNGQTDAGELIGRHVPTGALGGMDAAELLVHADLLETSTRQLLERAVAEGRRLTTVEQALVARTERLSSAQWRFQESCLPQAMRRGWWLLLDEMNLAEPQILERLNSALELPPTLVLSEHDGQVFGVGGDVAVHEGFRLFATLNPAEYSGRSVLSPAFRDRWLVWHQAEVATEVEVHQMLRRLVFGEHPVVMVRGLRYQAEGVRPGVEFAGWQGFDPVVVESLLKQLAMFHTSVARAAGAQGVAGLGRNQRERLTFTRRSLLSVMQHVSRGLMGEDESREAGLLRLRLREALELFYVSRLRDGADRKAMETMLRAADLGG
jgi:MoxR-like ATPase